MSQNKQLDSLKTRLGTTNNPIERFDLLNRIRENYNNNQEGEYDFKWAIEMLRIAQQANNDSMLAISNNVIGGLNAEKSNFTTALEYFFKAIPQAEKAKDKRRISSLYFDISSIYFSLQNWEEGVKYSRIGGDNLPDTSSVMYDWMVAQFYRNMARYFITKSQTDSALKYLHDLNEVNSRLKSPLFIVAELSYSGKAYAQMGDNEMAALYFKKVIALADSLKSPSLKINARLNYIPYLLNTNLIDEARKQSIQLLNLGRQKGRNDAVLLSSGFLRNVFDILHQTDSAYYYSRMESAIKDSIFNLDNLNKIKTLAFNEQLRSIEEEKKQGEEKEERSQNIQYALIAFGIISFIILFLLLSRSIITNVRLIEFLGVIALLIVFEFLNLFLHPFLERVTNHSLVLMLLALVCIGGLLVPMHHRVEKFTKRKLVEKNRRIRLENAKKTIQSLSDNGMER